MKVIEVFNIESVVALGLRMAQRAQQADALFLACAAHVEAGVLSAATGLSTKALALLPTSTSRLARAFRVLGQRSESWTPQGHSVFRASIPPASYRTAAIIERFGKHGETQGKRTIEMLFGQRHPGARFLDDRYRQLGEKVATMAREGLDTVSVAQSTHAQAQEIHKIERRRRPRPGHPVGAR